MDDWTREQLIGHASTLEAALQYAERQRDEARERARCLAEGELITAGIARLVDRQTQALIDKAKAAKAEAARLREALEGLLRVSLHDATDEAARRVARAALAGEQETNKDEP